MTQVRDLSSDSVEALKARLGPYGLVQRPAQRVYLELAKLLGHGETVGMAHEARLGEEILAMLQEFENLNVFSLLKLLSGGEVVVGRSQECDLTIHEPSVSSRHALIQWQADRQVCTVKDLDSRNGTFVNAKRTFARQTVLGDGDAISFGDAQFLLLRPETLREQLESFRERIR